MSAISCVKDVSRESVIDLINRRYVTCSLPEAKAPIGPNCIGEPFANWECCEEHRKLRNEFDSLNYEACFVNRVLGFCPDMHGSFFSANWLTAALKFFDISLEEVNLIDWYYTYLWNQGVVRKKKAIVSDGGDV